MKTLPGTLRGLLQPGAPVICYRRSFLARLYVAVGSIGLGGQRGWVVDSDPDHDPNLDVFVVLGSGEFCTAPRSALALDLERPDGVDRALRWLARRRGLRTAICPRWKPVGTIWSLGAQDPSETGGVEWIPVIDLPLDTPPVEALRLACLAAEAGPDLAIAKKAPHEVIGG